MSQAKSILLSALPYFQHYFVVKSPQNLTNSSTLKPASTLFSVSPTFDLRGTDKIDPHLRDPVLSTWARSAGAPLRRLLFRPSTIPPTTRRSREAAQEVGGVEPPQQTGGVEAACNLEIERFREWTMLLSTVCPVSV